MKHIHKSNDDSIPSPSIREYREIDRDSCNALHTVHTVHNNIESRSPVEIRMRKSVHAVFMDYCHRVKITAGQFYEEAGILFIDINPPPMGTVFNIVTHENGEQNLDDQLEEIILIEELSSEMKHLHRGKTIHVTKKKRLVKLLKRCQKLDIRGDKLEALMKEAMKYITKSDA